MSGHGADWYKREPETWLGGVRGMPERLHCVYSIVIELIYQDGGRTADNPKYIAGYIEDVGQAAVKRAIDRLVDIKKLYRRDGYLHNSMADEVARTKEQLSRIRSEAARGSGEKRDENDPKPDQKRDENEPKPDQKSLVFSEDGSEKVNDNSQADEQLHPYTRAREGEGEVEKKESPPAPNGAAPPKGTGSKGTRIPHDFEPDSKMIEFARSECGLSDREIRWHTNKMIDWFRGASGQKGVKKDWPATWRNWMRSESEKKGKPDDRRQQTTRPHGGGLHAVARADVERTR